MKEIELDARRRAPLAKVIPRDAAQRYKVDVFLDGTITLTPVNQ